MASSCRLDRIRLYRTRIGWCRILFIAHSGSHEGCPYRLGRPLDADHGGRYGPAATREFKF